VRTRTLRRLARVATTFALAGIVGSLVPAAASAAELPLTEIRLNAPAVPVPALADLRDVPKATRVSYLAVGTGAFGPLDRSATTGTPVGIDLFPDVHATVAGTWDSTMTDGTRAWLGHSVDEDVTTDAVLVLRPYAGGLELSTGTVWIDGTVYELRRVAAGVVAVAAVSDDAFETGHRHAVKPEDRPEAERSSVAVEDDPLLGNTSTQTSIDYDFVADSSVEATAGTDAYVDVLVLYTPAAAAAVSDVRARIKQYVANANLANANDGIGHKFNLVKVAQYSYTEQRSNIDGDLDNITGSSSIATLRANAAADLVVLAGSGYATYSAACGLAWVNNSWDSAAKAWGFSVWDVNATKCDSTTGAHEMGHNLTLRHDWANSNGTGSPFTYNHGLTSIPGDFTTVMAYDSKACPGGGCAAIPYWSNPNKSYNNVPRGFAEGTPQPAYDAKALAYVMPYAALWMKSANPFGAFESVVPYPNGMRVRGWAVDPDRRTTALSVQVWVDGAQVSTGTANQYRSDLAADMPGYGGYRGFSFAVGAGAGTHTVCVRAVNIVYGSANTELPSCRSITIQVNPVGAISGSYVRTPGGTRISGWALDPDTTNPISVKVTVDGVLKSTLTANASSPVPSSTWAEWGSDHGFAITLAMSSGVAHNVCITGVNVGDGVDTQMDCSSITLNGDPTGEFKTVHNFPGGIAVDGWVIDPDTSDYIDVQVTVDGVVKPTYSYGTWYSDYPPTSTWSAYGPDHSFWVAFENISVGTHTLCVTGLNVAGTGGVNKSLGCKSIYYSHDPVGSFTATRTTANVVEVKGWAIDPDTSSSISVQVTAAGVTNPAVSANQEGGGSTTHPQATYGGYHAFTTTTVVNPLGSDTVCVTALNVDAGANKSIGCVTV